MFVSLSRLKEIERLETDEAGAAIFLG